MALKIWATSAVLFLVLSGTAFAATCTPPAQNKCTQGAIASSEDCTFCGGVWDSGYCYQNGYYPTYAAYCAEPIGEQAVCDNCDAMNKLQWTEGACYFDKYFYCEDPATEEICVECGGTWGEEEPPPAEGGPFIEQSNMESVTVWAVGLGTVIGTVFSILLLVVEIFREGKEVKIL